MKRSNIVVVAVSYHSDSAALRLLRSMEQAELSGVDLTFVLVDNTERLDSEDLFGKVRASSLPVICVKSAQNSGYFGGAELGLEEYRRQCGDAPDWVLVSNVDIEFKDPSFFRRLAKMPSTGDVGVVAPSIWSDTWRRDRNPKHFHRPAVKKMRRYPVIYRSFWLANLYLLSAWVGHRLSYLVRQVWRCARERAAQLPPGREAQDIYAAQGSCIVLSASYFAKGGDLSYPCFLFGEEYYLAETTHALGLRTVYEPSLQLYHDDHVSTGLLHSRRMVSYRYASAVYLVQAYF